MHELERRRDALMVEASAPPPLEFMRWSMHSYGAMFCELRVNAITGEPRINRFLGSFDCGRILNPKTAASQFRGGIIMGLGMALMEETLFDERNGRIMNPSLSEYHVPVHMDVPQIDVIWTDIPDPHAPMGAHGIGEIGITGVAAAVANAVYNATGTRVRDLPITLDKLLGSSIGLSAAVADHGEPGADFVGFGSADGLISGEGLLPVVPGLTRVAVGLAGAGEAAVRAGLFLRRAGLGCEPESGGVVCACLFGVTCPEENFTKAVERVGLQTRIADLA